MITTTSQLMEQAARLAETHPNARLLHMRTNTPGGSISTKRAAVALIDDEGGWENRVLFSVKYDSPAGDVLDKVVTHGHNIATTAFRNAIAQHVGRWSMTSHGFESKREAEYVASCLMLSGMGIIAAEARPNDLAFANNKTKYYAWIKTEKQVTQYVVEAIRHFINGVRCAYNNPDQFDIEELLADDCLSAGCDGLLDENAVCKKCGRDHTEQGCPRCGDTGRISDDIACSCAIGQEYQAAYPETPANLETTRDRE